MTGRVPHISILRCGHRPKDDRSSPPTHIHTEIPLQRGSYLLHHPHHLNLLPPTHRHLNPSHLPIPLQRIKPHPCQSTPHLKPFKPLKNSRTLRRLQNQTPQTHPRKLRMHKDRPNLRRIHGRVKSLRHNRLHLMISAIKRLPETPPATSSQLRTVSERHKISPVLNQLTIHRKHCSQRPINLRRRIISRLQTPHGSIDQPANPRNILHRCNAQTKAAHERSIKVHASNAILSLPHASY
jgi:hypothetical protein